MGPPSKTGPWLRRCYDAALGLLISAAACCWRPSPRRPATSRACLTGWRCYSPRQLDHPQVDHLYAAAGWQGGPLSLSPFDPERRMNLCVCVCVDLVPYGGTARTRGANRRELQQNAPPPTPLFPYV